MATKLETVEATAVSSPNDGARTPRRRVYVRKTEVVLEAAEDVFFEIGYAATTMDAVADRANVSKRTVYSNFKNKEELFAAVVRKRCAQVVPDPLLDGDYVTDDPEAVLLRVAVKYLSGITSKRQVQLYQTIVAASRRFPEAGSIMYNGPIKETHDIVADFLKAQTERGNLALPDAVTAAQQLLAMLKTNLQVALLLNQPVRVTKRMVENSARSSVRLFLYGAASQLARDADADRRSASPV